MINNARNINHVVNWGRAISEMVQKQDTDAVGGNAFLWAHQGWKCD